MTSSIQTVCCCGTDNKYVEFKLSPTCTPSGGCGCDSDDPYNWRGPCGSVDRSQFLCTATGELGCSDCEPCGAVYMREDEFLETFLHTSDGVTWSPSHKLVEQMEAWWSANPFYFSASPCGLDSFDHIVLWQDSKPCGTANDLQKVSSDRCQAPVLIESTDPRNPLSTEIVSTEVQQSSATPEDMLTGNISNLSVGTTGDVWFASVFRVQSGATTGRRRIFDQGDENFGLILDGTTLKACFGSEANSAQETGLSTGDYHIVVAKRNSGSVSARLNGSAFSTNNVSNSDDISNGSFFKIAAEDTGDQRFRGQYGDLMVGTGELDQATIQKLEWFLANRFGLLGNLPSNHPYKNDDPETDDLTPREFVGRLSGHYFKIASAGGIPGKLTGGGCQGPQTFTISDDCRTITSSGLMRDCAGNVMFYGNSHPSTYNRASSSGSTAFPTNGYDWVCYYKYWVNGTPCLGPSCPETCSDSEDPFLDEKNLVPVEFAKGFKSYSECDDCSSCNPIDPTGQLTKVSNDQSCNGSNTFSFGSAITPVDPVNVLVGLANYTNQTRCPDEFLAHEGITDGCCVNPGNIQAPFLGGIGAGLSIECETNCVQITSGGFESISYDAPFDNCFEAGYNGGFCNPSGSVNCSCVESQQPVLTAVTCNFGSFSANDCPTGADNACTQANVVIGPGQACGSTCALSTGGSNQHICSEDRVGTQGRCGVVVATGVPPTDFSPIRCCSASQDPTPGVGCADEGYTSCAQIGYSGLAVSADRENVGTIAGASVVLTNVSSLTMFEASGTSSDRGLLVSTNFGTGAVADAYDSASCKSGRFNCGCPPQNLACDASGYTPMKNGITSIQLTCVDVGGEGLPYVQEYRYKIRIGCVWGTTEAGGYAPAGTGSAVFNYTKLSTSYDPRGSYSIDTDSLPADADYIQYPSTITVS